VPRAQIELAFIAEILTKAEACKEVPRRLLTKDHFWNALSKCKVVVPERMDETTAKKDSKSGDGECEIDRAAANLAGVVMQANKDTTDTNEGNIGLYDENEETGEFREQDVNPAEDDAPLRIDDDQDGEEVEVTVGGKSFGKIRKAKFNPLVIELIMEKGFALMEKMEISTLRHRMKCRVKRELKALAQDLFADLRSQCLSTRQERMDEGTLVKPPFRTILKTNYNITK
jgi:hypothetical protein